jgi:hypothetical protein
MLRRLFGKGPQKDKGGSAGGGLPWTPDYDVIAASAADNLAKYLMLDLLGPRGIHAETIMSTVGALAGFAAQHAIWETIVEPGRLPAHSAGAGSCDGAFVLVEAATGEKFYFGDLLNSYLVPTEGQLAALGPGPHTLWGLLAAGAARCRRPPLGREEVSEIFRHTASVVGTAMFGTPRLPKRHQPSMAPRAALRRAWPKICELLVQEGLPVAHWPTLIALVAHNLLVQTKDVLDPALSMRIVFEAAIPMSKIDPTTIS